ncbi:VWA domain-containing protein [Breoghania sp.]|uniref:VWA domain-containing protein n=1 Tax=Breoghania sp. TaxID=2065378 RepID=UPI0029C8F440|nr:VWA domain-containing protein [Breoghania sp.]
MKAIFRATFLFVFLSLFVSVSTAMAAGFTAQLIKTQQGKTETEAFYFLGPCYRMEGQEGEKPIVVIVDSGKKIHRVLDMNEKVFFEIASDDFNVLSMDPFAMADYMIAKYAHRTEGSERVNGVDCDKQVVTVQETKVLTRWFSTEMNFPVKIVMHQGNQESVAELKNIARADLEANLFSPPKDFKQVEEPGAAAKRKLEAIKKQEEAYAGITSAKQAQVPCYVKIAAGGELRVPVDKNRSAEVEAINQLKSESVVSVFPYLNGKKVESIGVSPWTLNGWSAHRDREFNKDFWKGKNAFTVDEVRVVVEKGLIYAKVTQKGPDRKDFYNYGRLQNGTNTDPKRSLTINITGDNPFGEKTTGRFWLESESGGSSDKIPFAVKNGETASFSYPADRRTKGIQITIPAGEGRAKIDVLQPAISGGKAAMPVAQSKTGAAAAPAVAASAGKAAGADYTPPAVMFILDASGSMWGQIQGRSKIEIAKEVMNRLVDGLPDRLDVGLSAYGHRRKGDCRDIETLIPPGPLDRAGLKRQVNAISPKGKTPLGEAVRLAARELRYTEKRATVVLVSDGLETCDADPCALAAELAATGVEFTVHVVGFAITKEEQARLRCLADKTGGLFLAAEDADSLHKALQQTMEKVQQPPPPVVVDPGTATLTGPGSVAVGEAFQVAWKGPDSRGDTIAVARVDPTGKTRKRFDNTYTRSGNPVRLTAPGESGNYELHYIHGVTGRVIGKTNLNVTPVAASVTAPAAVEAGKAFDVAWEGPAYTGDFISLARSDQRPGTGEAMMYTREGNPVHLTAPGIEGTYEVRYILGQGEQLLAKTVIEVKAAGASLNAPSEVTAGNRFEVAWKGPGNESDFICLSRPDQRPGGYEKMTYAREGNPAVLKAPGEAGTYEVRYILGQGEQLLAKAAIEVKAAGASLTAPPEVTAGDRIEVAWQGPGNESDFICLSRPDQRPGSYEKMMYAREGNPAVLKAPGEAGTYEVRYILGQGEQLLAKAAIEVKAAGASLTAPPEVTAGDRIEVAWQGPGNESDFICLSRPDQRPGSYEKMMYAREGNPAVLKAPGEAGTYEVRYILAAGETLLAKTPIVVNAATASITAPASAARESQVQVRWEGPGHSSDLITLARPDQRSGSYVTVVRVEDGNPALLKTPAEAGTYEIRYIMAEGETMLAKTSITIQ